MRAFVIVGEAHTLIFCLIADDILLWHKPGSYLSWLGI